MEGEKNVVELLQSNFRVETVVVTAQFYEKYQPLLEQRRMEVFEANAEQLAQLGTFETNEAAIAVAVSKSNNPFKALENEWVIALDQVRDPGNLGTIIRLADWYGIKKIVCSISTTECYNPKVIAASMGSYTRTEIYYTELPQWLLRQKSPKYAAVMDGVNAHDVHFPGGGILVMGNESNGIADEVLALCENKLTIPKFGNAESLNVAMATAVLCDGIRRNNPIVEVISI